ncbi:ECF-type sigma factor [Aeoliella sp. ICT_H6.2]|uniref:ECF-type sigma factor n=1 Tax=Aeoliella straminimaris TaxID=2954799 RepID=A0A9X2F876_9BACT|nr:ECF-type sigma factor [Aeoliella straminimaris]MCO6044070.1 ECF-type sigma factor [Aeoliella straminimaris]
MAFVIIGRMAEVTEILSQIEQGDPAAADQLLPLVYDELRKLAAARLSHEKPGQTLQATALVHEAYLRLVDGTNSTQWNGRSHFFAAAAEAMRRLLVEQARRKQCLKRGGHFEREVFDDHHLAAPNTSVDLLALNEALAVFGEREPRKAELVKLRYFAGLTIAQAAEVLGISESTADADWAYAKSWLRLHLEQ